MIFDPTENGEWVQGAWVAQSGKRPTLDFSTGHDLMVCEMEPHIRFPTDSTEPSWDSLPTISLLLPCCTCIHILSQTFKKKMENGWTTSRIIFQNIE